MSKEKIVKNTSIISPVDERDYTLAKVGIPTRKIPDEYQGPKKVKTLMQMLSSQCVAHSLATTVAYCEAKLGLKPNDYSRGMAYCLGQPKGENDSEGACLRDVLSGAHKIGMVQWDDFRWGNSSIPVTFAHYRPREKELVEKAQTHKIKNYYSLKTPEDIKTCILNTGACMFAMPVYPRVFTHTHVPKPRKNDKIICWHAVTCVGWTKTEWILQDSYSVFRGKRGIFYLPYDYCDFKMLEAWGITIDTEASRMKKPFFLKRIFANIGYGICYGAEEIAWWIKKIFKKSN